MNCMCRWISIVVVCSCFIGGISGCAEAPEGQLAATRAAIKAAQDAEADKYMPNNFRNISKALQAAEEEIALQSSAFVLSRNYKKAKLLLNNAASLANEIVKEIPQKKAETKTEVKSGLAATQKMIKETQVDIKKLPRSFEKKVRTQMAADLSSAENLLNEASALFESGNILDARAKLSNAQSLLKSIFNKLSTGGGMSLM